MKETRNSIVNALGSCPFVLRCAALLKLLRYVANYVFESYQLFRIRGREQGSTLPHFSRQHFLVRSSLLVYFFVKSMSYFQNHLPYLLLEKGQSFPRPAVRRKKRLSRALLGTWPQAICETGHTGRNRNLLCSGAAGPTTTSDESIRREQALTP
jgi:hypothetical protein